VNIWKTVADTAKFTISD